MENLIRHAGVIESISGKNICVRILQVSACSGCKVASHCQASESKEKFVNVSCDDASQHWHIGQEVVVCTQTSMAGKALLLGFGLPLAVMLAVLAVALQTGCSEGSAALLSLCSLVPCYLVLWLCRDRIARQIAFKLE